MKKIIILIAMLCSFGFCDKALIDFNNRNTKDIMTFTNVEIRKMLNYAKKHECYIVVDTSFYAAGCKYEQVEFSCRLNEFNFIKSDRVIQRIYYERKRDKKCVERKWRPIDT